MCGLQGFLPTPTRPTTTARPLVIASPPAGLGVSKPARLRKRMDSPRKRASPLVCVSQPARNASRMRETACRSIEWPTAV